MPGIYTMEVFADGFAPREVQFAIVEQNPTMLNITLYQVDSHPTPPPAHMLVLISIFVLSGHSQTRWKPK